MCFDSLGEERQLQPTLLPSESGGGVGDLGRLRDTVSPHRLVGETGRGLGLGGGVWITGGRRLAAGGGLPGGTSLLLSAFFFRFSASFCRGQKGSGYSHTRTIEIRHKRSIEI